MSSDWKFANCKQKPLLLISCLDWGLGHTTRSVPLIKEFLNSGCDLVVACNSMQKAILEPEFPSLWYVHLEGYDLSYGKTHWGTRFKILMQLRKILTRIKSENRWLAAFTEKNNINGLISDNRYGLYHPSVPSIFITHQLQIHSGYGRLADIISQKILFRFINRFSACWIPDSKEKVNLAGKLSHPSNNLNIPTHFIGPLSRFEKCHTTQKKFDVLILISGPEPQRGVFESLLLKQCESIKDKTIAIVRGLPESKETQPPSMLTVYNHLDSVQLNKLVCESEFIVCRSGYTTIMDMVKLKKKMIVIPTPGQPEQEYLARHLSQDQLALSFKQNEFNLITALQKATNFTFNHIDFNMGEYKVAVKSFIDKISSLSPSSTC